MVSSKTYFNQLKFIFSLLLGSLVIFLIVSICLLEPSKHFEMDLLFIITNGALIVICLGMSYLFSNKKIRIAKVKRGLREKLSLYRKALLIKWSVFCILGFYSVLAYLVTDNELFVFVTLLSIILIIMNRPTIGMACDNLRLDDREERIIKNPHSVI